MPSVDRMLLPSVNWAGSRSSCRRRRGVGTEDLQLLRAGAADVPVGVRQGDDLGGDARNVGLVDVGRDGAERVRVQVDGDAGAVDLDRARGGAARRVPQRVGDRLRGAVQAERAGAAVRGVRRDGLADGRGAGDDAQADRTVPVPLSAAVNALAAPVWLPVRVRRKLLGPTWTTVAVTPAPEALTLAAMSVSASVAFTATVLPLSVKLPLSPGRRCRW